MTEIDWDEFSSLPSQKATEINKARAKTYGSVTVNASGFALAAKIAFGVDATEEQCLIYEVLKKCVREVNSGFDPDYVDNLDDICGWTNAVYAAKEEHRGT